MSLLLAPFLVAAQAQTAGISSLGVSGGLATPNAEVLGNGLAALSFGNYQDPRRGDFDQRLNHSLGFGFLPGLELFGRFAQHKGFNGVRAASGNEIVDLSVNLKWQIPRLLDGVPNLAIGATDIAGGANYFGSVYAVASDHYGPLAWSAGWGNSQNASTSNRPKVLNGAFGGLELSLFQTGLSALLETDGAQRHVGARYRSQAMPGLGDTRFIATVQRTQGGRDFMDQARGLTSVNLSVVIPLQREPGQRQQAMAGEKSLPALLALQPSSSESSVAPSASSPPMVAPQSSNPAPTADAPRMLALAQALQRSGLSGVRIGAAGASLIVEYENKSYLHNEVDALGVALGLMAERAPQGIARLVAYEMKLGLSVAKTTVDAASYRQFLRDGARAPVQATLERELAPAQGASGVTEWVQAGEESHWSRFGLEIRPLLNYALATEVGAFDYSLAANFRASAGLWRGAKVFADWVQRVDNSKQFGPGGAFGTQLHRDGLRNVVLQQSFWLGPQIFLSAGIGRYDYRGWGAEGTAIYRLPGRDDSLLFKAKAVNQAELYPGIKRDSSAMSMAYRLVWSDDTWLEAAVQRYSDGSTGPELMMTRWFGDVALSLVARQGGSKRFVGAELSLPLTLRRTMPLGSLRLTGTSRYTQTFRIRAASAGSPGLLSPNAVRPADLSYKPEVEWLNSGRYSAHYLAGNLDRLREAFFLYGLPQITDSARP
ncbi:YjbH domain-containing protein [Roseateles oligotrophus]|uniref:YjbH domain-containing protein n=1 Tax=Roseateles oligotrophus TaxID=1769250 RepID=A0ABT2YF00_9BURK|nr:YjbH domain-containing protein [Roseateles oligotrophus]MCV2368628.1 YjbH domain-containing protein [Roseateles oligotrophus]